MKQGKCIISGYVNGRKFRPSNWSERLCEAGAVFDPRARIMRYSEHLRPRQCNEYGCSVYVNFEALDAELARYVGWFVDTNRLEIVALQPVLIQDSAQNIAAGTAATDQAVKQQPVRQAKAA